MLTEEQIKELKEEYLNIIKSINRENSDIKGLIAYLTETDFFRAPASTQYHCSFEGGLCLHSLNVYYTLVELVNKFAPGKYSDDTIKIVALLHDIYKINFYEKYAKNEKIYSSSGSKKDELGKFDWVSSMSFKVKNSKERMLLGTKGFVAYYIASSFLPLTKEESITLVNQYTSNDKNDVELLSILNEYNLVMFLHVADVISCYCIEKI